MPDKRLASTSVEVNPERSESLVSGLVVLWEDSVRHSHYFLSDADIDMLRPCVRNAVLSIDNLIVVYESGCPIAFLGVAARKIEMLFVASSYFGRGIGRMLVECAIERYGVTEVDVNEQNPSAAEFYRRRGFVVYDRTEYDDQGNPFPILKMRLS